MMNLNVWKDNYFNSSDVSMIIHGCVVSQFIQLYEKTFKN